MLVRPFNVVVWMAFFLPLGSTALPAADEPAKPTPTFELLVVDPAGNPVADGAVELRISPLPSAEQVTKGTLLRIEGTRAFVATDANGAIAFPYPLNPKRFDIALSIRGYAPYWLTWSTNSNTEPIPMRATVELDAGWSVGGVITDESGQPLSGVSVRPSVRFKKREGDMQQLGVGERITTDAEGKWRYDCVPASKDSVHVEIDHPAFKPDNRPLSRSDFGLKLDQPPHEIIRLDRGLSVTGTITDTDGNPVAAARIRTKRLNTIRETVADEHGRYRLSGLEPALSEVVVLAKGKAIDMREVRIEPDMEPVDFTLSPGGTVRIRVLDENDRPVPKSRIFFQRWRDRHAYFAFSTVNQYADENGVWVWNEAPLDTFTADICRTDGMQLGEQPLRAREEEYVFHPPPALVITGKVIDAETMDPVNAFTVVPGMHYANDGNRMHWDRSGQFQSVNGRYRLKHVHDRAAHFVRIEAEGYQAAVSRAIKNDEGNITIDFALRKGTSLAAIVQTPAGQPAEKARVALGIAGSQINLKNGDIDLDSTYCAKRETNAKGEFQFPHEEGEFQLIITHADGYAHFATTAETFPAKIKLEPWAKVEGTFRIGGAPGSQLTLSLNPTSVHSWGEGLPHIYASYYAPTDKQGRFAIDRVVPGKAHIGRNIVLMVNEGAKEVGSVSQVPVELPGGKTTRLELGGTGRAVIAQFDPPADQKEPVPWAMAIVNVRPDIAFPPRPNPPDIPEAIQNNPVQMQAWLQKWEQTPAGQAWKTWRLTVEALQNQRDALPHHWATVDRTGKVRLEDLPAGDYELSMYFSDNKAGGKLTPVRFTIPAFEGPRVAEPLDLGVLQLLP